MDNNEIFDADHSSYEETVRQMYKDLKELKVDFHKFKERLEENPPENKKLRTDLDELKLSFEIYKAQDKANKESDKRWMYTIMFALSIISFLLSNFLDKT